MLRYAERDDHARLLTKTAISRLLAKGVEVGVNPQAQREFWNVMTRPREVNGLGQPAAVATEYLGILREVFDFWDDIPGIEAEWRHLVAALQIKGVQVHDANHAASAIVHGATHILTFNGKVFARYIPYGLTPIDPTQI